MPSKISQFCSFLIIFGSIYMPELPEVQTVRRFLEKACLFPKPRRIKTIKVYYPKIIKQIEPQTFINKLINQNFTQIDRYGKNLFLKFEDYTIISHLRMSGSYIYHDKFHEKEKHDHIQFVFTDGNSLIYNDVRKFGTMYLVVKGQQMNHPSIKKLGPQVNNEETFTEEYLQETISSNKRKSIKEVLLDQNLITGIGNIYADEILYASRVHPQRKGDNLSQQNIKDIVKYSKEIIDNAIEGKGSTIRTFASNNQAGTFQNSLSIYDKAGQACKICNSTLLKTKVAGRGTTYCPKCQKK